MKQLIWITTAVGVAQAAALHGQVAVTEFMADPEAIYDREGEYIELFNHSDSEVDLEEWVLADEDSNAVELPQVLLAPGDYLLVVKNREAMETEWFGGTPQEGILELPFGTLANSEDEILVKNPAGEIVWRLAYGDDASSGTSTYLTDNDFDTHLFGAKGHPGVVRTGVDANESDSLGYEKSMLGADEAFESRGGDVGSPLTGHYRPGVQSASLAEE